MHVLRNVLVIVLIGILGWIIGINLPLPGFAASPSPDLPKELRSPKYVLMDFYADWCPTCQAMKPYVETLKDTHCSNLQVLYINTEVPANRKYVDMYEIYDLPVYILFDAKGKVVYRMDSRINPQILQDQVAKTVGNPEPRTACR